MEFEPIDFDPKLPLFIWDNYQTHDMVSAFNVATSFANKLYNDTEGRFISPGYNIIDRYVNYDLPWCDLWSLKAYEFIKHLSRSGIATSVYPNGVPPFREVQRELLAMYDAAIGSKPATPYPFDLPNTIELVIEPKEVATLTWLNVSVIFNNHLGRFQGTVVGVKTFERAYYKKYNSSDEPITVTFNVPRTLAILSLVYDKCTVKDEDNAKHLLYKQIDNVLSEFLESFNYEAKYVSGYTVRCEFGGRRFLLSVEAATLDDNFHYASLVRANNNPWGQLDSTNDLGYPPTFRYETYFNLGQDFLSANVLTEVIWHESIPPEIYWFDNDYEVNFILPVDTDWIQNQEVITYYPWFNYPANATQGNLEYGILLGVEFILSMDITVSYTPRTTFTPVIDLATLDEIKHFLTTREDDLEDYFMADSIRIKEIHAALQADKFANDDKDPEVLRVANLGYYIERIARVLGISVDSDGSIRSIRQRRVVEDTLPEGWTQGQFSLNYGGTSSGQIGGKSGEERDGIVYKNRCNRAISSAFNSEEYELGEPTFVLCENWLQYMESFLEDLDQGLNWQEMGAMAIPSPFPSEAGDNNFCTYEGLGTLVAELTYMVSAISKDTSQTYISSIVNQAMGKVILQAIGTPITSEIQEYIVSTEEGEQSALIPLPAMGAESPTLVQLAMNIMENLARLYGGQATLKAPTPTTESQP